MSSRRNVDGEASTEHTNQQTPAATKGQDQVAEAGAADRRRPWPPGGSDPWNAWYLPVEAAQIQGDSNTSTVLRRIITPPAREASAEADREPESAPAGGGELSGSSVGRDEQCREDADAGNVKLPSVGEEIGGFRLVLEMGHGAFARVFLAEETRLAGRLVVVKISKSDGDEPQLLARLHHANIMPVHSVHDDRSTGLRVLCMPYFGGANLAQVLQYSWGLYQPEGSGRCLVQAIDELSRRIPADYRPDPSSPLRARLSRSTSSPQAGSVQSLMPLSPEHGPDSVAKASLRSLLDFGSLMVRLVRTRAPRALALDVDAESFVPSRQFLWGANRLQAAVWIAARLAEGLDHAHSRGVLHRDIKPANILIAADGTPMLLDFNLAAESEPRLSDEDGVSRAALGGTLPYMSPEHLDALSTSGSTAPEAVDERSDIYSLGLILYEIIAGDHPFPEVVPDVEGEQSTVIRRMIDDRSGRVPSLRAACPDVPWSLDALVGRCLDPVPDRRYQSAHDLAEDLRRFLDDLPMKHCPEPSVKERLGKWARRHPVLTRSSSVASFCLVLLVVLGGLAWYAHDRMLGLSARMKLRSFERDAMESQFLLSVGAEDSLMARGVQKGWKLLDELGILEPDSRPRLGTTGDLAVPRTDAPGDAVRLAEWVGRLTGDEARRVRQRAAGLLILEARAGVTLADRRGAADDRRTALERALVLLDIARRLGSGLSSTLLHDSARYHAALGRSQEEAADRRALARQVPSTPEDWTMLATSLLAEGDSASAEAAIREALSREVASLWAWFALGHCYYEQGRYLEAAGAFGACVALGPEYSICHFNRGLALAKGGRLLDALTAYNHAIRLEPGLVEARANRAFVELELDRVEDALADLRLAERAGCRRPAVLVAIGESLSRLGRRTEADAWFAHLIRSRRDDQVARVARGMSHLSSDPGAAEADFSRVLALDPRNALAHYGTARLLRLHDHRGAVSHLDAAIESDPHLIDAIELRALERAHLGERSALEDVDRLVRAATPRRLYNAACALAIYGERSGDSSSLDRALQVLTEAIDAGFPAARAAEDPDLAALRDRPEFIRMTGGGSRERKPRSCVPRA